MYFLSLTAALAMEQRHADDADGNAPLYALDECVLKKIGNRCAALALYFFHYNFCRIHKTLRTSPAQAANITDELLSMESVCAIMHAANPPKKRGPYKKNAE